jgi:hypothetical protein
VQPQPAVVINETIDALFGRRRTGVFQRLLVAHARIMIRMGTAKETAELLQKNLGEWSSSMTAFPARVAKILDPSGRKTLDGIMHSIMSQISNQVLLELNGSEPPRAKERQPYVDDWANLWAVVRLLPPVFFLKKPPSAGYNWHALWPHVWRH